MGLKVSSLDMLSSRSGAASAADEPLVCDDKHPWTETGLKTRPCRVGMAVHPSAKPSDTLRCGLPVSPGKVGDLSGEMFSGCKIGHFLDVGLPDSASTSVRWAFGGLVGSMICAIGGLGSGLL